MCSNTINLIENLCRTCMGEEESEYITTPKRQKSKALFSIFNEPQENMACINVTIMDLLKQSVPQLSIETDDLLPKNVCKICLDKLVSIHEFQQKCLLVEHRLRDLIKESIDIPQIVEKDMDDPLTNNRIQEAFEDFRNILKIEMDEPLIDNNIQGNNVVVSNIIDNYNVKTNEWKENSDDDVELDMWDSQFNELTSNKRSLRNRKINVKNSLENPKGGSIHDLLKPLAEEHVDSEDKHFTCDQCGSRLKTRKSLKRHEKIHLRTHAGKKELRRRKYEIKYDDDSHDENANLESDTETNKNNNTEMSKTDIPKNYQEITGHTLGSLPMQEEASEDKPFACDQCDRRLKTRKSLKRHQKIHLRSQSDKNGQSRPENEWQCDSENTSDDIDFHPHEAINDDKQNCFTSKNTATVVETLREEGNQEDTQQHLLKPELKQEEVDFEEKPYVCDECGSRLKTRKSLKRHKRIHLRLPGAKIERSKTKHVCEYCQKVFCQSSSLKDHLRVHTGEQPYLCSECGKAFTSLSNMKQHFLRHGTARPYECPDCPKKFPCHSDLASHKAVHNKAKTHVCDICGAGFVKPYLLKKHKMYHTGEKNHKCDYCDMRFVLADQCRRHMRTHTGEKPYKCKYCVRAFAQSNDLIKHLRGHLGDNVYKCDLCPQGFRLQGELRSHFNTHKNDDDETRMRNLQALKDDELRLQLKFSVAQATDDI